jgi:hypothetical protein
MGSKLSCVVSIRAGPGSSIATIAHGIRLAGCFAKMKHAPGILSQNAFAPRCRILLNSTKPEYPLMAADCVVDARFATATFLSRVPAAILGCLGATRDAFLHRAIAPSTGRAKAVLGGLSLSLV